jgi:hypothetical protein
LPAIGRLGHREHYDLFSGHGADVVVQAQDLDACDVLDQRFQGRPRRFDQLGPDLFEQDFPLFVGRDGFDQLLFAGIEKARAKEGKTAVPVFKNALSPTMALP